MNAFHLFSSDTIGSLLHNLGTSNFVLLETTKIVEKEHTSFLFTDPIEHITCTGKDNPFLFLDQVQKKLDQGYYLAGWFAYEFGYLIEDVLKKYSSQFSNQVVAELGVFPPPKVFDHQLQSCSPDTWTGELVENIQQNENDTYHVTNVRPDRNQADYLEAIKVIKEYIAAGDTYQVNFTLKLLFDFTGSPIEFYKVLRRSQSVCYGAYIQSHSKQIMSFSPELFFRKKDSMCTVRPMKGTLRRGRTIEEDIEYKKFLCSDSKNRSENVMIVDLLRNDLGRLAQMGTVTVPSLFDVETYETLHQMTSTITAHLREDINLRDLFKALFPCGSVTGAPKIRTMEIIEELEAAPRGVYTGAIGFLSPQNEAVFNVPIRTVVINEKQGEMGIGSGIIHDSDPENEWEECLLKANFLTKPREEIQLIETLLWQPDNGFWLLDEHLQRLEKSAGYFHFSFDREKIVSALQEKSNSYCHSSPQRVRILLHKTGDLSVGSSECSPPKLFPEDSHGERPRIIVSNTRTDPNDSFLYHKTSHRKIYNEERTKAVKEGYYEIIFLNTRGEITEGAITSIFVKKDGCFYTPPVDCGLLPGVFRSYLLKQSTPTPTVEKVLTLDDLRDCDAVYVGNSVRGLVEVEL